ncbi:MAG TPA: hypothetical protein VGG15_09100 [Terriglobales bacterium]|jgi:hypothetical protein
MAKKAGKAKKAKKEHPVPNKLAALGMTALTAFATGVGTEAAANMMHHAPPPSTTTVIVETQPSPESEWEKWNKGLDHASSVPAGQEPEENFFVTLTGEQGMKQEFFFKSAPRHLAVPTLVPVPTLAPADHPTNPSAAHVAVKTNAYGDSEDYAFLADKAHIIQYLQQRFDLKPEVKDALAKMTEINIAKADNPPKPKE